jgi:hypothetical protein
MFSNIENALGYFYEVDKSCLDSRYMGLARILVGMEMKRGLAESMVIQRDTGFFHKTIDCEGIPFKCKQ